MLIILITFQTAVRQKDYTLKYSAAAALMYIRKY